MNEAHAIIGLILLVVALVAVGQYWVALILAFGGAMAIAAMPPSQPAPERKWGDVPVPEAGTYPDFNFWKEHVQGATESFMKILRQTTGIQYAADRLGDVWKKDLWDADVTIQWMWTPWGPMTVHKKADMVLVNQLMSEAYALQARLAQTSDPKEREAILKELENIRGKIDKLVGKGKY